MQWIDVKFIYLSLNYECLMQIYFYCMALFSSWCDDGWLPKLLSSNTIAYAATYRYDKNSACLFCKSVIGSCYIECKYLWLISTAKWNDVCAFMCQLAT